MLSVSQSVSPLVSSVPFNNLHVCLAAVLLERFVHMFIGKVVLQVGIHQWKNVNNLAVGFENAVMN